MRYKDRDKVYIANSLARADAPKIKPMNAIARTQFSTFQLFCYCCCCCVSTVADVVNYFG